MRGLLDWVTDPDPTRGLRLLEDDDTWNELPYTGLAAKARKIAGGIASLRKPDNRPVAIILPQAADFAPTFFAALLTGGTPCPISPPTLLSDPDSYIRHVAGILGAAEPSIIIIDPIVADLAAAAASRATLKTTPPLCLVKTLAEAASVGRPVRASPLGLLQFTSGSSGAPRGVEVTRQNLEHNTDMIRRWTRATSDDAVASWLPLHHDMGLIGCMLYAIVHGLNLQLMRPDQFIRDPSRWLECFGRHGATQTAAPSFAFAYCRKRVPSERLSGLDFSRWSAAIVGAERVDPSVLSQFAELLAPHGFRAGTFLPAYGLAEATLAVSGGALDQSPRVICLQQPNSTNSPTTVTRRTTLPLKGPLNADSWLVSCGTPLEPLDVKILDDAGRELPERQIGEIVITGPTVARGYRANGQGTSTSFKRDRLHTGDAGLYDDGELFVLGRIGDAIKLRGASVYMEDIEERVSRVAAIPRGRLAVFAGADTIGLSVAVLVEATHDDHSWPARAREFLQDQCGTSVAIHLLSGARGSILRTSSGKPRRRDMWEAWRAGALNVQTARVAASVASQP